MQKSIASHKVIPHQQYTKTRVFNRSNEGNVVDRYSIVGNLVIKGFYALLFRRLQVVYRLRRKRLFTLFRESELDHGLLIY